MFIENFKRIKLSTGLKYQSSFNNSFDNKLKSKTNLIDGLFLITIENGKDLNNDNWWIIYEEQIHPEKKNRVTQFKKLNQVKAFLQDKYTLNQNLNKKNIDLVKLNLAKVRHQ